MMIFPKRSDQVTVFALFGQFANDSHPGQPPRPATQAATQASHPGRRRFSVVDGRRLRRLGNQRGLSQEQLADRAGISPATGARLASPPHPAAAAPLGRLAAALCGEPAHLTPALP